MNCHDECDELGRLRGIGVAQAAFGCSSAASLVPVPACPPDPVGTRAIILFRSEYVSDENSARNGADSSGFQLPEADIVHQTVPGLFDDLPASSLTDSHLAPAGCSDGDRMMVSSYLPPAPLARVVASALLRNGGSPPWDGRRLLLSAGLRRPGWATACVIWSGRAVALAVMRSFSRGLPSAGWWWRRVTLPCWRPLGEYLSTAGCFLTPRPGLAKHQPWQIRNAGLAEIQSCPREIPGLAKHQPLQIGNAGLAKTHPCSLPW